MIYLLPLLCRTVALKCCVYTVTPNLGNRYALIRFEPALTVYTDHSIGTSVQVEKAIRDVITYVKSVL